MTRRVTSRGFVGRQPELATCASVLDDVEAGGPVTVLVTGEAGIGKSRLVRELRASATERGALVLLGHCLALETALPFAPMVEALRGLLGAEPPGRLSALAGPLAPELALLLPEVMAADHRPARDDRLMMFTAVRDVLRTVAEKTPVVLVVEDLHWSDASTRDLLSFLSHGLAGPVAIVLTVRDTELPAAVARWIIELERATTLERIDLAALPRDEVGLLAEALTGHRLARAQLDALVGRTGGNPFLVEEVLARSDDVLPGSLTDLLKMRLDALGPSARRLLEVAAVAGRERVDGALLGRVAALPANEVPDLLRELVVAGVFRVRDDGGYALRHGLLGEVADTLLVPEQRRELHRAWAEELASAGVAGPAELAALAHHWELSGEPARAAAVALDAGEAADRVFAHAEAADAYRRALRLAPGIVLQGGRPRVDVLRAAAVASSWAGELDHALTLGREALELVDEQEDPISAGMLHDLCGRFLLEMGDEEGHLACRARALDLVPIDPPTREAAALRTRAAFGWYVTDRVRKAAHMADDAVRVASQVEDDTLRGRALGIRALIRATLGAVEEARQDLEGAREALAAATGSGVVEASPEVELRLLPLVVELSILEAAGSYSSGLTEARALIAESHRWGADQREGVFARHCVVWFAFQLGRWGEARAALDELDALDEGGDHMRRHRERLHLDLDVATGEFASASARLANLRAAPQSDLQVALETARAHAELELWHRQPQAAVEACVAMVETPIHEGAGHLAAGVLATTLRALADLPPGADAPIARDAGGLLFDRLCRDTSGHRAEAAAHRTTGRAELARARDGDPSPWAEAAAAWGRLHVPYRRAYCHFREAEALLHAGRSRERAGRLLAGAASTSRRLGARPLLDEVEALARRARITLPVPGHDAPGDPVAVRPPVGTIAGLTSRERDVIALLATGRTNGEIARTLFVTEKTVEGHVSNVLRKLGASNRVEAASRYLRATGDGASPLDTRVDRTR